MSPHVFGEGPTSVTRSTELAPRIAQRFESLRPLIGSTPMLCIRCRYRDNEYTLYAKFEIRNFTGSIKDRMVLRILEDAYEHGRIRPGDLIAEATSGNTGIALAAIGRALGHDVRIFMPDWMSRERVLVIQSLGASVVPVSAAQGGFLGSIAMADTFAEGRDDVFLPRQFESAANAEAHCLTTAPEILTQLKSVSLIPDAFVAGVGTGGTVMGFKQYVAERLPHIAVHPLEPANSPTLRTGERSGKHRIQGISDEFIPPIVDLAKLDRIVDVWDGDAILMAQKLAERLGLGVGISSGANFVGALQVAQEIGPGSVVATVFPDSNKKYLSTALTSEEPPEDHFLTPEVELLGCRVIAG